MRHRADNPGARTVADAERIDKIVTGFDPTEPYSRKARESFPSRLRRVGVLPEDEREFFGEEEYQ
ncbi:MAG TPA: hypothetical protein VIS99_11300 [Terrimicrobiaceae bacterium]